MQYRFVLASSYCLEIVLVLGVIAIFIKAKVNKQLNSQTYCCRCNSFWLAFVLFFLCFLSLLSAAMARFVYCAEENFALFNVAYNLSSQFYVLIYFVLMALLFGRLVTIFKDSALQLTRRNIHAVWGLYALCILVGALSGVLYANASSSQLAGVVHICGALLWLAMIIVLVSSFTYKLWCVYKTTAEENSRCNDRLKKTITRSSMLAIISLLLTLVSFSMAAVALFAPNVHFELVHGLVVGIDITANTICIFLTFAQFASYYEKLCGTCDRQWTRCWTRIGSDQSERTSERVDSQTDVTSTRSGQDTIAKQ